MKRRLAKACFIFLEILGAAVAASAAFVVFSFWRLEQGPVSLNIFVPSAEFAISRSLGPGYQSEIENLVLSRGSGSGEYALVLSGIDVSGPDGQRKALVPRVSIAFAPGDFFKGITGPRQIIVEDPEIRIVRRLASGEEKVKNSTDDGASRNKLIRTLTGGNIFHVAFERAALSGAAITFVDEVSKRTWIAPDANVEILRINDGYSARAESVFQWSGRSAFVDLSAQYTEESGVVSVTLDGENIPFGDLLAIFYGEKARVMTAPITGSASFAFSDAGQVLSSRFDGRAEGGVLSIGEFSGPVGYVDVAAEFDPLRNRFEVERLAYDVAGNIGDVSGSVMLGFEAGLSSPTHVTFDLTARDLIVDTKGVLPAPLPIDMAATTGGYDVSTGRLTLGSFSAKFLDVALTGVMEYSAPESNSDGRRASPGVKADISLNGELDPKRLLRIWPLSLAMGARDWIESRLERARFSNLVFAMDLAPGAVSDAGGLPDESLMLTFDVSDIVAHYIQGMTPITQAAGHGVLRGNSFKLDVQNARAGPVVLSEGEVEFPILIPKWLPTYIRFQAAGDAGEMLTILNEKPLSLLDKVNFDPAQFSGDAQARIEIMRPNRRNVSKEEYEYKGTATFENLSLSEFYAAADLTEAAGQVNLETRKMSVKGDAKLGGSPIEFLWTENFYDEDGPSKFEAKGEVDSSTGDVFGVPTRQFLRGPVRFEAKVLGAINAIEDLQINADFRDAAITFDLVGWRKPQGFPAVGFLNLSIDEKGVDISNLNLVGHGVNIDGAIAFDSEGAIQRADFNRLELDDKADLSLSVNRSGADALNVALTGKYLDVSTIVETFTDSRQSHTGEREGFDWGAGLILNTRIDRLGLRSGVELMDASLDFWRDKERLQKIEFSALNTENLPISVSLDQMGDGETSTQNIIARTDDIGALMGGIFGIASIKGGEGVMEVRLNDKKTKGVAGVIEARNLRVVNASLLTRIFAAGSFNGLADLLNGDGIALDTAYADFNFADGVFRLFDARATGPSVGITGQGEIAAAEEGGIKLNGAVAPAYKVNSVLGKIPGLGDLFINRKGEGIVAISYQVSGTADAPTVFVNPLSALTPGVLRRIFEPIRQNGGEAKEPSSEGPPAEIEGADQSAAEDK